MTTADLARAAALLTWSRSISDHGLTWDDWSRVQAARDEDLAVSA